MTKTGIRLFLSIFLLFSNAAFAAPKEYTEGAIQAALADGQTVFVDFKADWCTTCAVQEKVINALLQEFPEYEENITFFIVDWDKYGNGQFAKSMNIPRRSTLVVLHGDQEVGRIVAGTDRDEIKALMDKALTASMM